MLTVNWKQIYEYNNKNTMQWILIFYDISRNHYVGVPVYNEKKEDSIYIKSINKYILLNEIADFNIANIKRCVYIKGKPLKISNREFDNILLISKNYFLNNLKNNTNNKIDGISYCKWCRDKWNLINKKEIITNLRIGAICWIDLGYNVGIELRKLRPAILWRCSADKKLWTVIPLTSKHLNDKYYFHYDLERKELGTAKIENLINLSVNRILEPYFIKNRIATITKKDNDEILKIIKKYYAFEEDKSYNEENLITKMQLTIDKDNIYNNIQNEKKVLT